MLSLPKSLNQKDDDQMEKFLGVMKRLNENPDFKVFLDVLNDTKQMYADQILSMDTSINDIEYSTSFKALMAKYQIYEEWTKFVSDFVALNKQAEENQTRLDNLDPYDKVKQ